MLIELLCVATVYACGIAYAHWVAHHRSRSLKEQLRYVLVAGNHEAKIEWYLRGLRRYSRRSGKEVQVTVWLRDSSDETGSIVKQMARSDDGIDWTDALGTADKRSNLLPLAGKSVASDAMSGSESGEFGEIAHGGMVGADESGLESLAAASGTGQTSVGEGMDLTAADWMDAGSYAGESETDPLAGADGNWMDMRLEVMRPIWIELSKPEDVARLPI